MVVRRASAVSTMLRIDRFSQRLLCLWALAALPQLACTLITDVDRSKIPVPPIIEPDPKPVLDAGAEDAGVEDAGAQDAGNVGPADSGPDAAPTEPELDAGTMDLGDAQAADGG
jgi:hypothetical protein